MKITYIEAKKLSEYFKIDHEKTPFREFWAGLDMEMEYADIKNGNKYIIAQIVIAHLEENPRYYKFFIT